MGRCTLFTMRSSQQRDECRAFSVRVGVLALRPHTNRTCSKPSRRINWSRRGGGPERGGILADSCGAACLPLLVIRLGGFFPPPRVGSYTCFVSGLRASGTIIYSGQSIIGRSISGLSLFFAHFHLLSRLWTTRKVQGDRS